MLLLQPAGVFAQSEGAEFFEKRIRPVLATQCYACHSSKLKSPMGSLVLDTREGLRKGGASGPAVVAGNPDASRLIQALRFANPQLQMPPTGKLAGTVIRDFEQWVAAGAPDPRAEQPGGGAPPAPSGMSIERGRFWWAFQPVREQTPPLVRNTRWVKTSVDRFVLAKLEQSKLEPSPEAGRRALIRRLSLNLTGLPPTYEETEAFVRDRAPDAYERLVESLLASPRYGERWGRYWLDVARYAEDNPTSEATNPPYPYAWRYRDWVIEAVNKDVPFDRFVKLQLAADVLPGATRDDLRALGYVGAAPVYHKDARLSKEVIETLASDDWDERVDAVTRGLLGLTVACARCHDHKFDPVTTKDYYALAGVFASTSAVERPLREMDPATEKRFLWLQQRLIHLDYLAKTLTGEPGTKPEEAAAKVKRFQAELALLKTEMAGSASRYPELGDYAARFGVEQKGDRRNEQTSSTAPFINSVYDAALWVDGGDPDLTLMDYRPDQPRDLPVFLRGNVATPGEPAARRFLSVLTASSAFQRGSGRLELAERIFTEGAPLAARVIVNRVWGWHFGKPLVATASDFGTQGERPTHPELLDDLAARFIGNGWSLKWLHREIVRSAAYRQSSQPRPAAESVDPLNRLVWRMNPRRLDIEAFRDSLLQSAGTLDTSMYGLPQDLEEAANTRRTVYARVSRSRPHAIFRLYDFPDASQHSPGRDLTTTPLQQLFVMNSAFLETQAQKLHERVVHIVDREARVRATYRLALGRDPNPKELDLMLSHGPAGLPWRLAQALLATNEMIFWP